jgi:hypothetical protein
MFLLNHNHHNHLRSIVHVYRAYTKHRQPITRTDRALSLGPGRALPQVDSGTRYQSGRRNTVGEILVSAAL